MVAAGDAPDGRGIWAAAERTRKTTKSVDA
jgi:hypothetical protein